MDFIELFKDSFVNNGIGGLIAAYFIWQNKTKDERINSLYDKLNDLQEKRIEENKEMLRVVQANTTSLDNLAEIIKDRRNGTP